MIVYLDAIAQVKRYVAEAESAGVAAALARTARMKIAACAGTTRYTSRLRSSGNR